MRGVLGRKDRLRADELGNHTATVNIADKDHRDAGRLGETHVGNVACAQVDLGRAPCPFDQDKVGPRAQAVKTLQRRGQKLGLGLGIIAGAQRGKAFALNDDLCADV